MMIDHVYHEVLGCPGCVVVEGVCVCMWEWGVGGRVDMVGRVGGVRNTCTHQTYKTTHIQNNTHTKQHTYKTTHLQNNTLTKQKQHIYTPPVATVHQGEVEML